MGSQPISPGLPLFGQPSLAVLGGTEPFSFGSRAPAFHRELRPVFFGKEVGFTLEKEPPRTATHHEPGAALRATREQCPLVLTATSQLRRPWDGPASSKDDRLSISCIRQIKIYNCMNFSEHRQISRCIFSTSFRAKCPPLTLC